MTIAFIVIGVILVVLVLWFVSGYNGLIKLRNLVHEAWAQIDTELKRRHDLIGNLVETVKGYAAHERGTLEDVMRARAAAMTPGQTPAQAAEHLRAPANAYGLLLGAIGVGAALGPTLLLRLIPDPRRPLYVFGPYVLRGLVDLVLASIRSLPFAAATLAVYGVGTSTGAVTFNSLLQSHVTDRTRGRVFALMDLLWQSGRLASLGVGGLLADTVGIRAVYYLGGILLLLAAAVGFAASRTSAPGSLPSPD